MKMLKNGREVDAFVTSRTPIPSPPCTKRGVALRYAARLPERPVQVHPDHHAEDGAVAVAVAEPADGVEPVDEEAVLPKRYKNRGFPSIVPKMCGECRHAMGRKRQRRTTRRRPAKRRRRASQVGGVAVSLPMRILKAGYGITKAIGDHQTKRAIAIGEKRRREVASGKRKKYAGESFNCSIM